MKAPTVSIILPTFNRLKYLRPAVDSVFGQSFTDWELIVADDGSDESTRAFLTMLATQPRVRVLWLTHAGIPAPVRNAALREARGEYVAFLDSDDVWMPSKLARQIESLRRSSARQWAYTAFTIVDGAGEPRAATQGVRWPCPDGWIFEPLLKMEAMVATSAVVARRELVEDLGGFDDRLPACEDYDLWLRCAARSEVDVVDDALVLKRQHGEHYSDDVTALEGWRSALEKARDAGLDWRTDAIVQKERASVSSKLAIRHGLNGHRSEVWRTLRESCRYSWRYPRWWVDVVTALVRVHAGRARTAAADDVKRGGAPTGAPP